MARLRWAVRCRARRKRDGEPCANWAIRGGFVCPMHGGSTPQVIARAARRLEQSRIRRRMLRDVVSVLQEPLPGPDQALAELRAERARLEAAGISLRTRRVVPAEERERRRLAAEDRKLEREAAERDRRAG